MSLEARHLDVLARIRDVGAPAQFVLEQTDYDEVTDTQANPQTIVVNGHYVPLTGDYREYEQLSITKKDPATILFVPEVLGQLPPDHSRINVEGRVRMVHKVQKLALGAKVILL